MCGLGSIISLTIFLSPPFQLVPLSLRLALASVLPLSCASRTAHAAELEPAARSSSACSTAQHNPASQLLPDWTQSPVHFTNTQCRELCDTQKWMRDCSAEVPQASTTPDCCPSCLLVSEKGERYNDPIIKARELLTGNSKLRLHKTYWKNCPVTRAKSIVSIHGIGKGQL